MMRCYLRKSESKQREKHEYVFPSPKARLLRGEERKAAGENVARRDHEQILATKVGSYDALMDFIGTKDAPGELVQCVDPHAVGDFPKMGLLLRSCGTLGCFWIHSVSNWVTLLL